MMPDLPKIVSHRHSHEQDKWKDAHSICQRKVGLSRERGFYVVDITEMTYAF